MMDLHLLRKQISWMPNGATSYERKAISIVDSSYSGCFLYLQNIYSMSEILTNISKLFKVYIQKNVRFI